MHDKIYNHFSTESNIGSRKICMDKLVFLRFFAPPATPLPPAALEMDTRDAGVTLLRSVAKLKLLRFDACSHYFEWASYSAKLNLVSTEFFVRIWYTSSLSNCSQVLFLSIPCEMGYGEGIYMCEGSVAKHNDAFVG